MEPDYKSEVTVQVQSMLGRMLKDFDALCTEHGLTYWVDSGTLLGAVRHKGFIPWDDDCDVAMPRDDFNKLVQLHEKLPEYIFFECHITNPSSIRLQTRLRHRYTRVKETGVAEPQGLFLDVFTFDNYNPDGSVPKGFGMCKRMNELATLNRWDAAKQSARSLKQYIIKLMAILFYLPNRFFPRWHVSMFGGKVKKYTEMAAQLDTPYFSYGYDLPWQHYKFKKDWVYPIQRMQFEDFTVNAPAQTEPYLQALYGSDYMTLPPEEKRSTHFDAVEVNDIPFG